MLMGTRAMTVPILQLENVLKVYKLGSTKIYALKGISMQVAQGEMVSIMGTSGCGKSTLLQIAGCIDKPTEGYVVIEGRITQHLNDRELSTLRNNRLGFVFQQFNLLPQERAIENVEVPLLYSGLPKGERREAAVGALEQVGLGDRIHHRPNELSGGQRQRVAIARAIVNNPALILADEPTGALDRRSGEEVLGILQRLNETGKSVLLVTHDPKIAMYSKRIIEFSDGKIVSEKNVKKPSSSSLSFPYNEVSAEKGGRICPRCSCRNRSESKYCYHCGFSLDITPKSKASILLRLRGERINCPICNTLNPPLAKYCIMCGSLLLGAYAGEPFEQTGAL